MAERKILQIMPATGWGAAFDAGEEEEEISPLVGWALVQDADGQSAVVGLVGGHEVELCDLQANFAGYVYLSDLMTEGFEVEDEELDDGQEEDDDDDFDEAPDDGPAYDPTAGLLN
jgi:hypothetical protein